jgi:hypothetical protein
MLPMRGLPAVLFALLAAGCGGGQSVPPQQAAPVEGPGPQLVVERFLQAANSNDWEVMRRLFGTSQQTIVERDGANRADRHMQLLASLLRHDDFIIRGRGAVPGRSDAASVVVELVQEGRRASIPFIVVPRQDGGWIIQEIQKLEDLT